MRRLVSSLNFCMSRHDLSRCLTFLRHFSFAMTFRFRCNLVVVERVCLHVPEWYSRFSDEYEVLVYRFGDRTVGPAYVCRCRARSADGMKSSVLSVLVASCGGHLSLVFALLITAGVDCRGEQAASAPALSRHPGTLLSFLFVLIDFRSFLRLLPLVLHSYPYFAAFLNISRAGSACARFPRAYRPPHRRD
jgi:hypothetical protein